ncbi:hypothetical protein O1611_g3036 [Lasiodiplodia mahajangana]|uniref:Uncharacterized protein n=1 Tax=Lasiodiplodia mahajangana TaxID=1108764 RepID=A0ACC2JT51_9PEZI|nr:hypothetical protein O1611_g3036 [Lasiodiplodia mahajangana]
MSTYTYTEPQPTCGYAGVDPTKQRPRPPPNRRRDKPQLSCNICRRRKYVLVVIFDYLPSSHQLGIACANIALIGCDVIAITRVQHARRGLSSSCTYVTNTAASTPPTGVQDRLRHLENLVVSYMNQNEATGLASPPQALPNIQELDASLAVSDVGSLKSSSTETKYHDQTHWDSILDAITQLKEDFGGSDDSRSAQATPESSSINSLDSPLLYGCKRCSRDEILAAVPPKEFTDYLVSQCFEMLELSSCAISKLEFLKQYNLFWENPQQIPIMWIGLLFSVLAIGVHFREYDEDPFRPGPHLNYVSLSATYREKTVQCLTLGEYTRCGPYVLETLLHHFTAEFMRRRDVNNDAWIILNTTVHLANIATSGQLGVPRLINDSFVDTAEPRNLLDSDFNANSTELPPSRPDSDPTPILVVLSRLRTGRMYIAVASVVTNTQPPTYAQVLQVDRQIEDMFQKIPEYCRIKPQSNFVTDPPQIILQRIFIQMNYHKTQIILHWRYLTLANQDDRYSYSTKTTVAAALKILNLHQVMYEGLKTGGPLYSRNGDKMSESELNEIKQTLRQTKVIHGPRTPMSADVKRVAAAIESVLPGVLEHDSDESSSESQVPTPAESSEFSAVCNEQDPFVGSTLPFFDPMFEGAPMFPSHINDMGVFIDSVLAGSMDSWCEVPNVGQFF